MLCQNTGSLILPAVHPSLSAARRLTDNARSHLIYKMGIAGMRLRLLNSPDR